MASPTAKEFRDELIEKLRENKKTSWGKNELVGYIFMVFGDFVDQYKEVVRGSC